MPDFKSYAAVAWAALGAWLMRHWLTVLSVTLGCLAVLVLFSGKKSQDAKETVQQAVSENVLTKKQVKAKDAIIARNKDSIRVKDSIIYKVIRVRDSLTTVAKKHDARADSTVKALTHESTAPDPDATPARVEQLLTEYKPRAYFIDAQLDSLK